VLEEIRIRGLGVIDDATLELGPGLTVVTGETGAGKTMVVSGLYLLFGGRADPTRVRSGSGRAVVDGRLRLPADSPVLGRARDAGADVDEDGSLLLSRAIAVEGRSRAFLGGSAVPVGVLAELAEAVLTVHGQADQMRLLRPAEQRAALDRYAGSPVAELLDQHRAAYQRWQQLVADLADRTARVREMSREADLLRHGLAEIAAVRPEPGEDERLTAEATRLAHADALRVAAQTAHDALAGDPADPARDDVPDVAALLAVARHALAHELGTDAELGALEKRCAELGYLAADLAADLASYLERLDADPARLAEVEDRRAALKGLTRKYAETADGVLAWAADAEARLSRLDVSEEVLAALAADRDAAEAEVAAVAGRLSNARAVAAEGFAAGVTAELAGLAMAQAAVRVQLRRRPPGPAVPVVRLDGELVAVGPDGVDEVEILLRPHPGAPALPIQKGASGGELSRVMLAVEVVFAGADPVPTMVFDEVDAGVGGRAAVEVGRRLARLARRHQVVVVTHLPQVAAYADRHIVVDKALGDGRRDSAREEHGGREEDRAREENGAHEGAGVGEGAGVRERAGAGEEAGAYERSRAGEGGRAGEERPGEEAADAEARALGLVTRSDVRTIADADRVRELARMLAGQDGSELGRAHAEELLAAAAAEKASFR
jgi:DNA repair protein RecN (Recombination protein N)